MAHSERLRTSQNGGYAQSTESLPFSEIGDAVHALAQPLTIIQGQLELALLGPAEIENYQNAVDQALSEMNRANELLRYLSELIKACRSEEDLHEVHVDSVLAEVMEDLRDVFQDANVGLELTKEPQMLPVVCSESRMRQAFFYLLQVMRSEASPGGQIAIHLGSCEGRAKVKLSLDGGRNTNRISSSGLTRVIVLARTLLRHSGAALEFDTESHDASISFLLSQ